MKFEAPDYSEEGIEEFRKSIYNPDFIKKLEIYATFNEGKIVGMIAARAMNHIALYFVDENYQGMGIGRQLYDYVSLLNIDNYFTVNSAPYARRIYEHMGFEYQSEM